MSIYTIIEIMIFNSNYKERGTTLIEAMVTVLVLSLGLIPTFTTVLVANNLIHSIQNNLTASFLAQEGLEIVRGMRDFNWFSDQPFNQNFIDGTYRVDWSSRFPTDLVSEYGDGMPLKINSSGLYNYSAGYDTGFVRKITITKDATSYAGCDCELKVVSEVSWPDRGKTKTIKVESHLYDWTKYD